MSEQEIRLLEGYDLKSITRADDCDCYDVVLTPRPLPDVRLRIRKEDLVKLAIAEAVNKDDVWELNTDSGTLYSVSKDSEGTPRRRYSSGIHSLVSAEIGGECTHFYGYHKEEER